LDSIKANEWLDGNQRKETNYVRRITQSRASSGYQGGFSILFSYGDLVAVVVVVVIVFGTYCLSVWIPTAFMILEAKERVKEHNSSIRAK